MVLKDYHVHTTYCDGKSTAEETVKAVTFTPHLAPFKRGMLASIYVKPSEDFKDVTNEKINEVYQEFYKNETFVRVLEGKTLPGIACLQDK